MINLLSLSKFFSFIFLFVFSVFNLGITEDSVDIWKKKENKNLENEKNENSTDSGSLILIDDSQIDENIIDEEEVELESSIVGLFDPEENNLSLSMWAPSDGNEIKKAIKRINKIQLSKFSEDLLFKILFTNSFPPQKNLSADEFLDLKINWLIKNERVEDLENLLKTNTQVGKKPKALKFLVEEYLSSADVGSACEKIRFINKDLQNTYLEKFNIYCLVYEDRNAEAQLMLDLLKERNFKDPFFEDKINFLLGFKKTTSKKIVDNDLFNFYLCQITNKDFNYVPNEKSNKYIWRYLAAANLIQIEEFEDEGVISNYENAAAKGTFDKKEIFNIYKKISFNINQLLIAEEIYKTLPPFKSRALIYQKILLSDDVEKKLYLTFLLKELFDSQKLLIVYSEELSDILKSIDPLDIPESYSKLVEEHTREFKNIKNIKFDNETIHKSKIIKYFLEEDYNVKKTEKDIKNVYKKIRRNKKYFISIKDIIVFESLLNDGFNLPESLNIDELSNKLTMPEGLVNLTKQREVGLVMLKIVEIIGQDNIEDLDPDTLYFIVKILNNLQLKKIRNNILSKTLPNRV